MEAYYNLVPKYEDLASNFPSNFTSFESNISSIIELNSNIMYDHRRPQTPFFNLSPCNNSSTSNETDEDHMIINDRKHRRMISNRESARRSRVRKQRQLEELCTLVDRLKNENHGLMVKQNRFLESHAKVVEENDKLRKECLELKKLVCEVQLDNTYATLEDLHDDGDDDDSHGYGYARYRIQSSRRSKAASTTLDSSTLL